MGPLRARERHLLEVALCEGGNGVHAIGKGIELQGAQTTPPSEANKAMFWKRKNCRVLKRVCGRADNVLWFGRR